MKNHIEHFDPYLFELVKKKVDLSEFLSKEMGCNLRWHESNVRASTICPMPSHKDSKPSFHIEFVEDGGFWRYYCFGCGAKGTIIDFCMEYYNLGSSAEAVLFICDKFGFKKSDITITDSINAVKKRANLQKKINCAHIVAARQCFTLLKKDYVKYNIWVADKYKEMNKALDEEDLSAIEQVSFEVSKKMQGE